MPTAETLLNALNTQATSEELRRVAHFIGECVARREISKLAQFHARARQLRRLAESGSWHRGFADSLTAYLDGYFAELEPTIQREKLAREVAGHALWREILHTLRDDRALNQVTIGEIVAERTPGVASSKSAISIALEDLRVRELVEYVPGKTDRRERIHSLTVRGRELLAEPILASVLANGVSDKTSAGPPAAPREHGIAIGHRDRPDKISAGPPATPSATVAPNDSDGPRERKASSVPPFSVDG